ncbi:DUF2203 family protein [bacterium]|nr:DUF2203 family protein [candidate division CSSED10-310 bacterium]
MSNFKRIFKNIDEVNEILPKVVRTMSRLREQFTGARDQWQQLLRHSGSNGGPPEGLDENSPYVVVDRAIRQIIEAGGLIRDVGKGVVEFPMIRDDRIVMLSWRVSDGAVVRHWHEIYETHQDRKPIDF